MDIRAKVEDIVSRLKKDPNLLREFQESPVKTIETLVGVDLPDDTVNGLIAGVRAKLGGDKLGGLLDSAKSLFGK